MLLGVRRLLASLPPDGAEAIAHGMPAITLGGRPVVACAARSSGWSLDPFSGSFLDGHAGAIRGCRRTTGSLHIPWHDPWPQAPIEGLVLARRDEVLGQARPGGS